MHKLTDTAIIETTSKYRIGFRIVIILIIGLLLTFVVLKIVRAAKRPANATYVEGGGPVPIGWDPSGITDEIFSVIDGVLVSSNRINQTYMKFNELNDNQMIDVYNKWLDRKYDQVKKYYMFPLGTLKQAVFEGPGYLSIGGGPNQKDVMLANLTRLKLS